jgi:hypothetical protein
VAFSVGGAAKVRQSGQKKTWAQKKTQTKKLYVETV